MDPATDHPYDLSVVATVYNDSEAVRPLVEAIRASLRSLGEDFRYEVLLVNDGSSDDSAAAIAKACLDHPEVKGLNLARNVGQQVAMSAGVDYASGRFVVMMDGDLQNPPSEIPTLYAKIQEGYDVVYAVSKQRDSLLDRATSAFHWFVLNRVCGVQMVPDQLMFRIVSARFAEGFRRNREKNRFVAGICSDLGMRAATVEIQNQPRTIGRSSYSLLKRFNLFLDIVLTVSTLPLNFMIYLGLAILAVSGLAGTYHFANVLLLDVPPGFTSIVLSILFFGSLTVLLLGVIGRYLSFIYMEVKDRPLYTVESVENIELPQDRPQRGW